MIVKLWPGKSDQPKQSLVRSQYPSRLKKPASSARAEERFPYSNFKSATQVRDIALWWRSKMSLIFAAEMRWILVAYAERCAGGIHIFA